MGILERILANKREEIALLKANALPTPPAARTFSLKRTPAEPLRLICEIKRKSPSAGTLSTKLSVAERARAYQDSGASMLSVLCDRRFFDGAFEHLQIARESCSLPILCKDFVIDERQLDAARAFGADAVLLIARCLDEPELARLFEAARARDLTPFVEIVSEDEARAALAIGADFIGVNARDLDTLVLDREHARRVLSLLPERITRVHLSGLSSADAIVEIAASGVDAALVGEALMRLDDPRPLLTSMVSATRA